MKFMLMDKRKFLGTILGSVMFLGVILALTYAFYVWESEKTLVTLFNISDEYFYCESGIENEVNGLAPVFDYRSGSYQTFAVNNIGRQDTTFSISLNITDIDESLISESFKYKVMVDRTGGSNNCADINNNSCEEVGSGDFSKAVVGMNTLVKTISLPNNSRYQYYLFMYIDGNMENDSAMQNSSMTSVLDVCEVVVFLDYNCGNIETEFIKVTDTYAGLPTNPTRDDTGVTYNTNGGSITTASSGYTKKFSHTFNNWYLEENFGTIITSNTIVTSTTNHTLYARWNAYSDIDGSDVIKLPSVSKPGYTFAGWYSDEGLTNKVGDAGGTYTPDFHSDENCGTIELYAKWNANALDFDDQSFSKVYSLSDQTISFVGASNGTGNYTYSITDGNSSNYFSISGTTITIKDSTPVATYTLKVKAEDVNSKVTKTATITIEIKEATPVITVNPTTLALTYKTAKTFTYTYDGDGTVKCVSSNTQYATCSVDTSKKTVTVTPVKVRSTAITVGVYAVAGINYAALGSSSSPAKTVSVTVAAYTPTISLTPKSAAYTASAISANTATVTLTNNEIYSGTISYTYYDSTDCSGTARSGAPTNVGNYSVKASIAASGNYAAASKCVTHDITKSNTTTSLTERSNLIYTGSAISANTATAKLSSTSATISGASFTYTYYDSTDCSGTARSGAPTNVGSYSVKATLTGTSNYNSSTSSCVRHTIGRKTNEITGNNDTINVNATKDISTLISNSKGTLSYKIKSQTTTGSTLNGSTLTAGVNSSSDDTDKNVVITVTDDGGANYASSSVDVTITVQKYTRTLSWNSTTPSSVTYGDNSKKATVSLSGTGGTAGSVSYSSNGTDYLTVNSSTGALTPKAYSTGVTITASLARTTTVKAASATKSIAVARATGNIALSTNKSVAYGTSSTTFTVSSHHGGTLSVKDDNDMATSSVSGTTVTIGNLSTLPAGTKVKVTVTSEETAQYNAASADFTLTISKKTPSITLSDEEGTVELGKTTSFTATPTVSGTAISGTLTVSSNYPEYVTVANSSSGTYGETASFSSVTTGTAKTIYYKGVGVETYNGISVIFTPTDTTNYNSVTADFYAHVSEDVTKPATPTITRSDYNTFTYNSTDGAGVTCYYVSKSSTTPSKPTSSCTTSTATTYNTWTTTKTKDINGAGTYYVWAVDAAGNISASKSIAAYTISRSQGTGTTLTTKYDSTSSSTGTSFTSNTVVLAGTPIWAKVTANTGYGIFSLKHGSTSMPASGGTFNVSASETITSSAKVTTTITPSITEGSVEVGKTNSFTVTVTAGNGAAISGRLELEGYSDSYYTLSDSQNGTYEDILQIEATTGNTYTIYYKGVGVADAEATYISFYSDDASYMDSYNSTVYIAVTEDATKPIGSISSTNTPKSRSQTATLTCTDEVGVTSYYWGDVAPTSSSEYTTISSTTNMSLTKTVQVDANFTLESQVYYLSCKDANGNVSTTVSKSYTVFEVWNMLLQTDGEKGTYTTNQYSLVSGNVYIFSGRINYSDFYTIPDGADASTFVGMSQDVPSDLDPSSLWTVEELDDIEEEYGGMIPVYDSFNVMWFDRIEYTISYDTNGGSGVFFDVTKRYGVDITLSTKEPTKSGYNFLGWSTSSTATTATYQPGATYTANAGTTLYAVWEHDGNVCEVDLLRSSSIVFSPTLIAASGLYYFGSGYTSSCEDSSLNEGITLTDVYTLSELNDLGYGETDFFEAYPYVCIDTTNATIMEYEGCVNVFKITGCSNGTCDGTNYVGSIYEFVNWST